MLIGILTCDTVGSWIDHVGLRRLILFCCHLVDLVILVVYLFLVVVSQENLDVITLGRCTYIVIFNKLLLFANHILQVDDSTGLQLKI